MSLCLPESSVVAGNTTTTETATTVDSGPAAASNRLTIHGELAQAVGTDSMSFSDVTAVAAHNPNPAVRAEALRVGLSILEDESELSESFLQALEQRDDALEIARGTARETHIEALRLRARAIEPYLEPVP